MGNSLSLIMLAAWPAVAAMLFSRLTPRQALIWVPLLGYLLLPPVVGGPLLSAGGAHLSQRGPDQSRLEVLHPAQQHQLELPRSEVAHPQAARGAPGAMGIRKRAWTASWRS